VASTLPSRAVFRALVLGEPELGAWCSVCQLPTRLRVPVHLDDPPLYTLLARLEVCPGCGSTHAVPKVELIPEPASPSPSPSRPKRRSPRLILTRRAYERACRRHGSRPLDCAWQDCRYPGYAGCTFQVLEDDGTVRFFFCGRRHRRLWLGENGFLTASTASMF